MYEHVPYKGEWTIVLGHFPGEGMLRLKKFGCFENLKVLQFWNHQQHTNQTIFDCFVAILGKNMVIFYNIRNSTFFARIATKIDDSKIVNISGFQKIRIFWIWAFFPWKNTQNNLVVQPLRRGHLKNSFQSHKSPHK